MNGWVTGRRPRARARPQHDDESHDSPAALIAKVRYLLTDVPTGFDSRATPLSQHGPPLLMEPTKAGLLFDDSLTRQRRR